MLKVLIAVIAEPRHTGMIKRTLHKAGVDPESIVYIGGDANLTIPMHVSHCILRTVSCSHAASAAVQNWRRVDATRLILRANSEGFLRTDLERANLWHPLLFGKRARAAVLQAVKDGHHTYEAIKASTTGLRGMSRENFWSYVSDMKKGGLCHNAAPRKEPARYVLGPAPAPKTVKAPKQGTTGTVTMYVKAPAPAPKVTAEVAELTEWVELLREECAALTTKLTDLTKKHEEGRAEDRAARTFLTENVAREARALLALTARHTSTAKDVNYLTKLLQDRLDKLVQDRLEAPLAEPKAGETNPVQSLVAQLRAVGFTGSLTLEL